MRLSYNVFALAFQVLIGVDLAVANYAIGPISTGINSATGERPARRDITEMRNDVPAFSLYIQALQAMQDNPETNLTSWFQVSGIHGRPYTTWDSVPNTPGAPQTGYCTHSDALFISWHRPYLALYEQVLARHVQTIAKSYNNAVYQTAADRFRIPYWDWAAPPYQMPDFFSTSTITITTPSGQQNVWNPLAAYRFRRFPYPSSTFPTNIALSSYPSTVRRPNSQRVSDPNAVNSLLASQAPGQAQQLYTVFSRATAYNNMATQSSNGPSFENPHGWLHITVGGNGHMTNVGYAGFDPIFLLHHTNVDRLGAMWQAIYPNAWMTPATEGSGTWTLVPRQTINSLTPLLPFHQSDGATPWTTDAARYTKTFGYSYPDVRDWEFTTTDGPSRLAANVTARVNALYNLRGSSRKRSERKRAPGKPAREWTIEISAPNNALQGQSYSVVLFLGQKPADPFAWVPQSVGSMFVLAQPMSADSVSAQAALPAKTEVIITDFLQDRGIDTTDVKATKKYIDTNLDWGVQNADGVIVPNKQFKGLKLLVEDDIVKLPDNDSQLPKYLDKTLHPDVTPVTPVNTV